MSSATHSRIPLAIVGMACRLPGADDLDDYWRLIRKGESAIREIPPERLDRGLYYDPEKGAIGKTYSTRAGLVDYPPFPADAYRLPAGLADSTDIAHLSICDVARSALLHAQMDPLDLKTRNTGVYIGHTAGSRRAGNMIYAEYIDRITEYLRELEQLRDLSRARLDTVMGEIIADVRGRYPQRNPDGSPDLAANVAAGLITRAFGLNGPHLSVDAACASSLKALSLGARALQQGRIDMAIVGGASYCTQESLILFSQAQSVSATDSRPFDADADGLITSEGYVAVVLKTLERALADGDPIQAVIRGIGQASDGKGKSLWAPRGEGQILAMQRAYHDGLDLARVQYIEAHATSTQVGDATELNALVQTLERQVPAGTKIPIGSVKGNIGHTLETAGIASMLKVILAMQHGIVPPAANLDRLNPKIDWERAPIFVPRRELPWENPADGGPRRGAVNAFGIGGLNLHLVLDEYVPEQPASVYMPGSAAAASAGPPIGAEEPIAIIGMGTLLPGAHTVEAFWDLLLSGRDPKCAVPPGRWPPEPGGGPGGNDPLTPDHALGGFLPDYRYDWRSHKVPPKQVQNANPLQFMLLDAAEQALEDAGLRQRGFDRTRTGVVVGTIFGGDFSEQLRIGLRLPEFTRLLGTALRRQGMAQDRLQHAVEEYHGILLKHMPALLDETGSFTSSTLASRITKTFDLMGGALALDAGPGSGLAAASAAVDMLRSGSCDTMICAAGQRDMSPFAFGGLARPGLLAEGEVRAAFDAHCSGVVPGEGAAVLVLKRLVDAQRDGDRIQGVIRSIAAASDSESPARATETAMRRALQHAGLAAADVVAVESAPIGPAMQQEQEVRAIADIYCQGGDRTPLTLTSMSAQTGYTGGCSGVASLVKSALALQQGTLPGAFGTTAPCPAVVRHAACLRTQSDAVPIAPAAADQPLAIAVSSGSGTTQTLHAILQNGPRAGASRSAASGGPGWRLVRIAADSHDALAAGIDAALRHPARALEQGPDGFSDGDRVRLAIVAENAGQLTEKLRLAAAQHRRPESRGLLDGKGIFCRTIEGPRPRIAFLFPGQGSQYFGMLKQLIQEHPAALEARRDVDTALAGQGLAGFEQTAWGDEQALGSDVHLTQSSVLMADTILLRTLEAEGIRPQLVAGHSFGEYAALLASGAWTLETAALAARLRGDLLAGDAAADGQMAALDCSGDEAEKLLRELGGRLYVANYNAPGQTVVGGERTAMRGLVERVRSTPYRLRLLNVPCPFHTPLLSEAATEFRERIADLPIRPPVLPLYSCASNRLVADPEDIRDNLVNQFTRPVRYVDLVRRIAGEQPTVFVECGPQQVLTRLNQQILDDSGACIAADSPRRPGREQLLQVRALLECSGAWPVASANKNPATAPVGAFSSAPSRTGSGRLIRFDATLRRRSRHRDGTPRRPVQPLPGPPSSAAPAPAPAAAGPTGDLERFLIDFVVEETGYPAEIVEIDADLEGDLGIDSIKKAQLFGELAQHFPIAPSADMTLDDYPTLRHVKDFIQQQLGDASPGVPAREARSGKQGPVAAAAPAGGAPQDELDRFLIEFVVEETGYPAEIVEMDADLEGDLGIDSIKKAQLIGELAQHFPITPTADLSLDDFPTLRHVKAFIAHSQGTGAPASTPAAAAVSETSVAPPHPSAYAAGHSYGEARRSEIRSGLMRMADKGGVVQGDADIPDTGALAPAEREAARGIADAAGVLPQSILAYQRFLAGEPRDPARAGPEAAGGLLRSLAAGIKSAGPDGRSDPASRRMRRFVLRTCPAPLPEGHAGIPEFDGRILIYGDGPRAEALRDRLGAQGQETGLLPPATDAAIVTQRLAAAWEQGPAPHLLIVCDDSFCPGAEQLVAADPATGILYALFRLVQEWLRLVRREHLESTATLAAVTRLGADLGFASGSPYALDGGLAGLLKAVRREQPASLVKLIDTRAQEDPDGVANAVLAELAARSPELETAWNQGRRHLVQALPEPAPRLPDPPIRAGGTWVVSGGARGITAVAALELARRYQLRLHLLGSSEAPRIDPAWRDLDPQQTKKLRARVMKKAAAGKSDGRQAWDQVRKAIEMERNLRAFSAAGVQATYHCCDLADRTRLQQTLQAIRAQDGPIEGIVHGAGFEHSTLLGKKRREEVQATLDAKLQGALNLLALTAADPLRHFIGFGSTSGRFGGHGQSDYSLASDMLCKLSGWLRSARPDCLACCFHWPAWDQVGMATRPEIRAGLERAGLGFMPPREGVDFLLDELEAGLPESEVLILDQGPPLDSDGILQRGTEAPGAGVAGSNPVDRSPMIDAIERNGDGWLARATLNPAVDVFLTQHKLRGRPLLPAVVSLEMFAEAAQCLQPQKTVIGLSQVEFLSGFAFPGTQPQAVRIRLTPTADAVHCELIADSFNAEGTLLERDRVYARARVDLADAPATLTAAAPGSPLLPYVPFAYPGGEFVIWHGEPLRCLDSCSLQRDGGRARLQARAPLELAGSRQGNRWLLPAALLDGCMVACGTYLFFMMESRVEIPRRIERLRITRLPREAETCVLRLFFHQHQGDQGSFDFTLYDASDQVLLSLEGYQTSRVEGGK